MVLQLQLDDDQLAAICRAIMMSTGGVLDPQKGLVTHTDLEAIAASAHLAGETAGEGAQAIAGALERAGERIGGAIEYLATVIEKALVEHG